jgi:uncharacterized damage-inducible protein DinB
MPRRTKDGSQEKIMSTETIKLLARYNSHANQEMGRILAELTIEEWNKPLGGYFPTIRSLASHIFSSDLAYLKRFAALRPFAYVDHPLFQRTIAKGEVLFPAFSDYEPDRKALDTVFTRFAEEVTPADLAKRSALHELPGRGAGERTSAASCSTRSTTRPTTGVRCRFTSTSSARKNDFSGIAPLV